MNLHGVCEDCGAATEGHPEMPELCPACYAAIVERMGWDAPHDRVPLPPDAITAQELRELDTDQDDRIAQARHRQAMRLQAARGRWPPIVGRTHHFE
jgi:hypothetical protein